MRLCWTDPEWVNANHGTQKGAEAATRPSRKFIVVDIIVFKGDAFNSFVTWSKASPALRGKFGEIKSVHLKLLGSYSEKTRGDKGSARFVADVTGSKSSGDVDVVMVQTDGVWIVWRVNGDG